ncbi:MAG: hypothetical protein ACT4PW_14145 [Acidimicrobiia bacterium]
MKELLLPRTDAAVAVQGAIAAIGYTIALVAARRRREVQTFILGLASLTAAWFGLRALH